VYNAQLRVSIFYIGSLAKGAVLLARRMSRLGNLRIGVGN